MKTSISCPSRPAPDSAPTRSWPLSAPVAWAKSTRPATRASPAPSPSKICAEQFSERFEREARAISALNHPNICTLHDVGPNYLVMEYIEGPTLSGPIPLAGALPIARQITEALEAAHEKGIIHRD